MKRSADILQQAVLEGLRKEIDTMLPRVQKGNSANQDSDIRQRDARRRQDPEPVRAIHRGDSQRQAGKPNEFGKMVKLQEAENQIVTDFEIYSNGPVSRIYPSLPSNPTNRN